MTRPRRHIDGQIVMMTRRCFQRRFLLRPDDWINSVIAFEIGRYAPRHNLSIHGVMAMSNHIHKIASDHEANRSDYMQNTMREISKARNRHLNRTGSLWDGRPYGDTYILQQESIEEKLLYIWLNPVKAGLVQRAEDWPGFKILPRHWGKTLTIPVPEQADYYGRYSPEVVEFTPQPPPGYRDMPIEEAREYFEELLRDAEDEFLKQYSAQAFAGPKKVRSVDPTSRPSNDDIYAHNHNGPRFAAKDAELIERAKARYEQFLRDYEKRRQRWVKGQTNICFPAGTVWFRKCTPCQCSDPDDDEPGIFASGTPPG